jgi:hypothetical protein
MQYNHGSLDAQAVTDLISNVTSLTAATEAEDPRPWLGWGTGGDEQLSVFLHELTHHWCFSSPVAFAIAGLVLRSRLEAFRAIENDSRPKDSIIVDLVRAETATFLLRPLAEGLALFAEFDVITRTQSKAISPVFTALLEFFVDPREAAKRLRSIPAELALAECANQVLLRLRTNPTTLNRKASLLLKPFLVRAGGYLPGYLTVKSLWRVACRRDFRLANETDLFLMYFRSFLYDDWGLVAALLKTGDNEIRSAEHLVNYVNGRLQRWESLTAEDVSAYENYLLQSPRPPETPGILVESSEVSEGRLLIDQLSKELMASMGDRETASAIASWNINLLNRRQFMNLVSVPVQVRAGVNDLEVTWQGSTILKAYGADLIGASSHDSEDASLEVIFTLRQDRFERAVVVHRNEQMLACVPIGLKEHAEETRKNVISTFRERPRLQAAESRMRALMAQVVQESWFSIAMEHCRTQVAGVLDPMYRDIALRFARDYAAMDQSAEMMATRGMKPILGGSGRLIRGLALLGLVTSINPAKDFVQRKFEEAGLDLMETLEGLQSAYEKQGYPPEILQADGAIFSTI